MIWAVTLNRCAAQPEIGHRQHHSEAKVHHLQYPACLSHPVTQLSKRLSRSTLTSLPFACCVMSRRVASNAPIASHCLPKYVGTLLGACSHLTVQPASTDEKCQTFIPSYLATLVPHLLINSHFHLKSASHSHLMLLLILRRRRLPPPPSSPLYITSCHDSSLSPQWQ